jgi:hypothetical protein
MCPGFFVSSSGSTAPEDCGDPSKLFLSRRRPICNHFCRVFGESFYCKVLAYGDVLRVVFGTRTAQRRLLSSQTANSC